MDRLSAMSSFVRVVEDGGFSAAARRLDISTSVVTTHVKSLEDRLGVLLLTAAHAKSVSRKWGRPITSAVSRSCPRSTTQTKLRNLLK
jgi:hypothetical protein